MVALLPTKIPQFATAGTAFNPELAKIPAEELAKHPDIRIANSNWGLFLDEVITKPTPSTASPTPPIPARAAPSITKTRLHVPPLMPTSSTTKATLPPQSTTP